MGALPTEPRSLKLEAAFQHLQAWRKTKPQYGRIPAHIWDEAVALVGQLGLAAVARALCLDYKQLKKHVAASGGTQVTVRPDPVVPGFVELPGGQFFGNGATSEVVVEVSNPAGARLTLRLPTPGVDIFGLVQAFCGCGGRR